MAKPALTEILNYKAPEKKKPALTEILSYKAPTPTQTNTSTLKPMSTPTPTIVPALNTKLDSSYKAKIKTSQSDYRTALQGQETFIDYGNDANILTPKELSEYKAYSEKAKTTGQELSKNKTEYRQYMTDRYNKKQQEKLNTKLASFSDADTDTLRGYIEKGKAIEERDKKAIAAMPVEGGTETFTPNYSSIEVSPDYTDDEKAAYYALLGKYNKKQADDFLEIVKPAAEERAVKKELEQIKADVKDNKATGVAKNMGLSFLTPLAYADTGVQAAKNLFRADEDKIPAQAYSIGQLPALALTENTAGLTEDIKNPALRFLANTGLSIGQYATKLPLGATAALGLMGTGAAGLVGNEAMKRGATTNEAFALATAAGAVEIATEKISIDKLYGLLDNGTDSVVKAIINQAATEGTEEVVSEYMNLFADNIIIGDRSELNQYIKTLEEQGTSKEDATRQAVKEFFITKPFLAGLGGVISGGVMAGSISAVNGLSSPQANATNNQPRVSNETTFNNTLQETTKNNNLETINNVQPEEAKAETIPEEAKAEPIPKKAENIRRRAENAFVNNIKNSFGFNRYTDRQSIKDAVTKLSDKYLSGDEITKEDTNNLLENILESAIVEEAEFYNEYKDVKGKVKSTPILVSSTIKDDIDYNDFRKSTFGKLKLVSKDGIPVDSFYQELSEKYPNLYPAEIINPSDQLKQIAEVQDSITKSESAFGDLIRGDDAYFASLEKTLSEGMSNLTGELENVKRYSEERVKAETITVTKEEVLSAWKSKQSAQRVYNKELRKNLLTEKDTKYVDLLLSGDITLDTLPEGLNKGGILNMYNAKKPIYEANKIISAYSREAKKIYSEQAAVSAEAFDGIKEKAMGLQYARETPERNIEDVLPKDVSKRIVNTYIKPIHAAEANATRYKAEARQKVKSLNISDKNIYTIEYEDDAGLKIERKASESGLVQLLGEKKITYEQVKAIGADAAKIQKSVDTLREIYNDLIGKLNDTEIRNGYAPTEYRKDYFPHFTENKPDSVIGKIGSVLGINIDPQELPTSISGLTYMFRPGKQWFSHSLSRKGDVTDYDAIKGFDRYLEGAGNVIYHTDNIQRLRALEDAIRYRYSDVGVQKAIDDIRDNENLAPEDKRGRIEEIFKDQKPTKASSFVVWLRNYTDTLAGKKYIGDRVWENNLGRPLYDVSKTLENRVAANMVALNPGSWLTNFIPITQISGVVSNTSLLNAMKDTVTATGRSDGLWNKSDFLTNRKGSTPLAMNTSQKLVKNFGTGMEVVDHLTAEMVVRAKYYDNMKKGMSEVDAIKDADDWAARVMADRSKGALPTIFNAKNPISKLLTMFQVEVNNQFSYYFKDIPNRDKGKAALVYALLKVFIGAFLYNEAYEKLTGRRVALDPISIITDTIGDFTDKDRANLIDVAMGKDLIKDSNYSKNTYGALAATAKNIGEEIPFIGGLMGGGRLPISSALPDFGKIGSAATGLITGEANKDKSLAAIGKELAKPASYLVPPVGGGQLKKAIEGYKTVSEGGSYGLDSNGKKQLQFPVEDKDLLTYAKAMTFGKYSLPRAKEYIDSEFKSLSANNTKVYEDGLKNGIKYDTFMNYYINFKDDLTADEKRYLLLNDKKLSPEQKSLLNVGLISDSDSSKAIDFSSSDSFVLSQMSETAQSKYPIAEQYGYSVQDYALYYSIIYGDGKKEEKIKSLTTLGLTEKEAYRLWSALR